MEEMSNYIDTQIQELELTNKFLLEKMCENCIYDDNIKIYQEIKLNKKQIRLLSDLKKH